MLRSIVVIWTLALALVAIAATSGCQLGGCLNGDDCSAGLNQSGPDMALAQSCASQCGTCAADQICFQSSGAAQLPALCAHPCADDRDCGSAEKCAVLFASLQPSICISAGKPRGCGGASPNWHCDLTGPTCKDASTLSRPFSDAADQVCGWEQVHCANGCANGACL